MNRWYQTMAIIHNRIKCNKCGDIIESNHRHDFKWCSCGAVAVDGGHDYLKRAFREDMEGYQGYTDLSETENDDEDDEHDELLTKKAEIL